MSLATFLELIDLIFIGFFWVSVRFRVIHWVEMASTEFYWVITNLNGLTRFYWVFPSFTGFDLVLLGLIVFF